MTRFRPTLATIAAALALGLAPGQAEAQSRTYGFSVDATSFISASALDAGDLVLYGGRLTVAPHPWARFGLSVRRTGAGEVPEIRRPYDLTALTLDLEGTLLGRENRLYGVLAPGAFVFSLDEIGAAAEESVVVPAIGVGLGVSVGVFGPLSIDLAAQDVITWTRDGALRGVEDGDRAFGHSPRFDVRMSFSFKKRQRLARFEDLPVSFSNEFQPTRARAPLHQDPVLQRTKGQEHTHPADGVEQATEAPYTVREASESLLLGTVYFASGSSDVSRDFQSVVRDIALYLQENTDEKIVIRGFTSTTGNTKYNLTLAQQRANAVREQLVMYYQIDQHRIDALTGGMDPENGEEVARRVEVRTVSMDAR